MSDTCLSPSCISYLTMKNVMEIFLNCEESLAVRKDNSVTLERKGEGKGNYGESLFGGSFRDVP